MASFCTARKEHRKSPFLKAFARVGTISGAAKAARISRDAVHDWRRNDPSFARMFAQAKRRHKSEAFPGLDSSVVFLKSVIKPFIPQSQWLSISAAIAAAVINLNTDLKGGRRRMGARTGEVVEPSLPHNGFDGVAISNRGRDGSANDL